ncbi:hypothetical protein Belba_3744 [Belliella baltica DSM 15883]|uniref:Uncharacterized protein n=1 Tax=Belliella baltica (strain DSM 15883 / CIP 108006 / LMG 21964 / BA134) TaxID=866536 RepID=I3ZAG1_BELBD|nr:hypothetical protein Belba_3744 [Belliella baltica DSM 15883]
MEKKSLYAILILVLVLVSIILLHSEVFHPSTIAIVFLVPAAFLHLPLVYQRRKTK